MGMNSIDFIEKYFGIKLLPYQKVLLEKIEEEKQIYLVIPPKIGRRYYLDSLKSITNFLFGQH